MSISAQISTINVPFYGDNLYLVSHNGEPFVPMKPVVEGMGLDWASQFTKIKQRFAKGIVEITIPSKGGGQPMTCLAFRKFAGWLHTINVGKVRAELREKVARYQEECDDVLYQYWTKGDVKSLQKKTITKERASLRHAVNMLVDKKGLCYDDAYNVVHQRFGIDSIDELETDQIPLAIEYIQRIVLEGEFIGKENKTTEGFNINVPYEGRWLVYFHNGSPEIMNVNGYNCLEDQYIKKMQRDVIQLVDILREFSARSLILTGDESPTRLKSPLINH